MHATEALATLTVSYRLGEYISIVSDYAAWRRSTKNGTVEPERSSSQPLLCVAERAFLYLLLHVVAPPVFLLKKRSVGDCLFTVTAEKIERRALDGVADVPWSAVVRVHKLSRAYLVEKKGGAMPLPYRCFTPEARAALEAFLRSSNVPVVGAA